MAIDPKKLSLREIESPAKLKQLDSFSKRKAQSPLYSYFVRFLRLALPLVAVGIIGMLMAWPRVEETLAPIPQESILPRTVAKNELLNPRFESEDKKKQPFTITASRAVQSARNPEMILLEAPMADITLRDGTWLAAEARKGAYKQDDERLLLEGGVKLFHDKGYEMKTEKMLVDLKFRKAWSEVPITGQGPAGTLQAEGMQADTETGVLLFKGPVKLVLNKAIKGLE